MNSSLIRCVICNQGLSLHRMSAETETLDKQLSVIFFLKKFLKYPLICEANGTLEFWLMHQGNPDQWIQFCSPCSDMVQEAMKLYFRLSKVEKQLEDLRLVVERKVSESFEGDEETISPCLENFPNDSFFATVRQAIYEKGFNQSKSNQYCLQSEDGQVSIKAEYPSDTDVEWPDPLLLPEKANHTLNSFFPESGSPSKFSSDFKDGHFLNSDSDDDSESHPTGQSKYFGTFKKARKSLSKSSDSGRSSFQNRPGPQKTSVESRTCPICNLVFTKSSLMTRHLNSQCCNPTKKQESRLPLPQPCTVINIKNTDPDTNKEDERHKKNEDDTVRTVKVVPESLGKERRSRKPVLYAEKYEDELSDEMSKQDTDNYSEDSDSEYIDEDDTDSKSCLEEQEQEKDLQLKSIEINPKRKRYKSQEAKCPICEKLFKSVSSMQYHLRFLHNEKQGHSCQICGKVYGWPGGLRNHVKQHEKKDSQPKLKETNPQTKRCKSKESKCHICEKVFKSSSSMQYHLKFLHNKTDGHVCHICGKIYGWPGGLRGHMKQHEEGWMETKPFKCTFEGCNSAFRNKSNLSEHKIKHLTKKEYICSVCGASFRCSRSLSRHKNIHKNIKPHMCEFCGTSFLHKHALQRHNLYKHREDAPKPFVCDQCGKSFKVNQHLIQHLRSKSHGGEGFKPKASKISNSIAEEPTTTMKNQKELTGQSSDNSTSIREAIVERGTISVSHQNTTPFDLNHFPIF